MNVEYRICVTKFSKCNRMCSHSTHKIHFVLCRCVSINFHLSEYLIFRIFISCHPFCMRWVFFCSLLLFLFSFLNWWASTIERRTLEESYNETRDIAKDSLGSSVLLIRTRIENALFLLPFSFFFFFLSFRVRSTLFVLLLLIFFSSSVYSTQPILQSILAMGKDRYGVHDSFEDEYEKKKHSFSNWFFFFFVGRSLFGNGESSIETSIQKFNTLLSLFSILYSCVCCFFFHVWNGMFDRISISSRCT